MQEPSTLPSQMEPYSTAHIVHALTQFAVAVRRRFRVVILALMICALLGGLYYATATRYYSAKAQLLVLQSGDEVVTSMSAQGGRQQSPIPTYETLFASAKVLDDALEKYMPEETRDFVVENDLADVKKEQRTEALQKRLTAKSIYGSNIIEIEYRSKNPEVAVRVVEAVLDSYEDFIDKTRKGTAQVIHKILEDDITSREEQLSRDEATLQEFRARVGPAGNGGSNREAVHPSVQRAMAFNEALIDVQKRRIALEASLEAIRLAVRNGEDLRQHLMASSDAVGKELMLSALGLDPRDAANQAALDQKLLSDQAKLASLAEHCGPNHPQIVALREEIRLAQEYLRGYQQRVNRRLEGLQEGQLGSMLVSMVEQKLQETRKSEAGLEAEFNSAYYGKACPLHGELAKLETLEFKVRWQRDLLETLRKKLADVELQKEEKKEVRTARVSNPVVNKRPVSPRLAVVVLTVLVGGLGLGLLVVYVLDTLDDRFRCVEETESWLGAPVMTVVRTLPARGTSGLESLQVHREPDAAESESFRTLRTALSLADRESRRIVVTSAEPGDGKTTVLANLAVCYAQSAKKTLLVDADLRRPGMTALLGLRGAAGLSDVIRGSLDVAEMAATHVRASGIEGLDVLAAGPRPSNPAELLAAARFAELLAWAETAYDQILVDSPPALAASDMALVGRLVDGVLLVVQPEKNRRRMVMRAAEGLRVLKIPLLGVVINRVASDNASSYYAYGGGYGYQYHGEGWQEGETRRDTGILTVDQALAELDQTGTAPADAAGEIVPRRVA